ncbi:MAG: DEAD/DEAH box helicase [Thermofilaceae archaeon]
MRIEELNLPPSIIEALSKQGVVELFPPQQLAVRAGLLEGASLVVAAPTASGKTLIAVLAAAKHLTSEAGKVLYLTPLRSLASEKYEDFSSFFEPLGFKVALSIGDYDSTDEWLGRYNVIVTTNEKADSLLRHRAPWLREVSLVVADEIHLVGEANRGPTLELLLSRIRRVVPNAQLLGLSATIRNVEEIANWLSAKPVVCDWRPVPLKEGVYYDGMIEFSDGSSRSVDCRFEEPLLDLTEDTLREGGQVLIFNFRRRGAVNTASRLAVPVEKFLSRSERQRLQALCSQLLSRERNVVTEKLVSVMARGVAFHHAGLSHPVRKMIEDAFRSNLLKVVVATPTLAAGVNLPARRVIIADRHRYNVELGVYEEISVMEYKQMAGRAGRPKYDKVGEAVLIARTLDEAEYLMEEYVKAQPERVTSKLSSERALRSQILAEVASGLASSVHELRKTLSITLFAVQGDVNYLLRLAESALKELKREGFVEASDNKLEATPLGRRVAELYLDPRTASLVIKYLSSGRALSDLAYLHLLALTPDMPKMYLRKGDREWLEEFVEQKVSDLLVPPPEDPDEYEMFLAEVKVAALLLEWIEEKPDDYLYDKYDVGPGDLYAITQTAEWLTYAASELSKLLGYMNHYKELALLRERIRHGVKPELLELTSIKGIGRVRARALYSRGYRSLADIARATESELAEVPGIGPTLAKRLKEAVTSGRLVLEQDYAGRVGLDQYF